MNSKTTHSASVFLWLLLAASTSAQEGPASPSGEQGRDPVVAWQAVAERLRGAADADRVAFEASWHWESGTMGTLREVPGAEGAVQRVRARRNQKDAPDRASGVCYQDGFGVVLAGPPEVEFVQVGAHSIARVGDQPWRAGGRDGLRRVDFVPDPQLLLRGLLEVEPAVLDRSIGELDGRPVEFVALNVSDKGVERLVETRALREPDQRAAKFRAVAEAQNLDVQINEPPIVDVSLAFDVATRQLVRVRVRALVKQLDSRTALRKLGGRGGQQAPQPAEVPADEPPAPPKPTAFREGLPVRKATDLMLLELEYVLGEPGAGPPRTLSAEQEELLGNR